MTLSSKIAANAFIQIVNKIISTILSLITIALVARHLGISGFGQYTTAITYASFFAIVADLGLTLSASQLISKPGVNENKILSNLMLLRVVSAIGIISIAPLSALFVPYDETIRTGILLSALSLIFVAFNQIFVAIFQKNLRTDKISLAETISRIFMLGATVWTIKAGFGLYGILAVNIFTGFFSFALHYFFSRDYAKVKLEYDRIYWLMIIKQTWPLALTIALNLIYLKADTLLLSLIQRPSKIGIIEEVGIYGAAYKVIDVLATIPFMLGGIILPIMTRLWHDNDKKGFAGILQKSFEIMMLFSIPIVFGTHFFSKEIMTLIAGPEFADSGLILNYLVFANLAIFFGNMFAHAIVAIEKQRETIIAYILTALTALAGYILLIPRFSYFGAAWTTIYSEAFIAFASLYIIREHTGFFPDMRIILKSIAASLVMTVEIILLQPFAHSIFIAIPAAMLTYTIAIYLFRGIKKEDLRNIFNQSN